MEIQGAGGSGAWLLPSRPGICIISVIRPLTAYVGKLGRPLLVLVCFRGVRSSGGLGLRWLRFVVHGACKAVPERLQAVAVPPQAIPLRDGSK